MITDLNNYSEHSKYYWRWQKELKVPST